MSKVLLCHADFSKAYDSVTNLSGIILFPLIGLPPQPVTILPFVVKPLIALPLHGGYTWTDSFTRNQGSGKGAICHLSFFLCLSPPLFTNCTAQYPVPSGRCPMFSAIPPQFGQKMHAVAYGRGTEGPG